MCELSERSWLIITSRFVMLVLDLNEMSSSVGRWLDSVILNCLVPASITSVLPETPRLHQKRNISGLYEVWYFMLDPGMCIPLDMMSHVYILRFCGGCHHYDGRVRS